jgi:hypothetical protein
MTSFVNANCARRLSHAYEISFQTLGFPYLPPSQFANAPVIVDAVDRLDLETPNVTGDRLKVLKKAKGREIFTDAIDKVGPTKVMRISSFLVD